MCRPIAGLATAIALGAALVLISRPAAAADGCEFLVFAEGGGSAATCGAEADTQVGGKPYCAIHAGLAKGGWEALPDPPSPGHCAACDRRDRYLLELRGWKFLDSYLLFHLLRGSNLAAPSGAPDSRQSHEHEDVLPFTVLDSQVAWVREIKHAEKAAERSDFAKFAAKRADADRAAKAFVFTSLGHPGVAEERRQLERCFLLENMGITTLYSGARVADELGVGFGVRPSGLYARIREGQRSSLKPVEVKNKTSKPLDALLTSGLARGEDVGAALHFSPYAGWSAADWSPVYLGGEDHTPALSREIVGEFARSDRNLDAVLAAAASPGDRDAFVAAMMRYYAGLSVEARVLFVNTSFMLFLFKSLEEQIQGVPDAAQRAEDYGARWRAAILDEEWRRWKRDLARRVGADAGDWPALMAAYFARDAERLRAVTGADAVPAWASEANLRKAFEQRAVEFADNDYLYHAGGGYTGAYSDVVRIYDGVFPGLSPSVASDVSRFYGDYDLFAFSEPGAGGYALIDQNTDERGAGALRALQVDPFFEAQHGAIWAWHPSGAKERNIKDVIMRRHGPGSDEPVIWFTSVPGEQGAQMVVTLAYYVVPAASAAAEAGGDPHAAGRLVSVWHRDYADAQRAWWPKGCGQE
jgi:hypothetical protein